MHYQTLLPISPEGIRRIIFWFVIIPLPFAGIYYAVQIADHWPSLQFIINLLLPLVLLFILSFAAIGIGWTILDKAGLPGSNPLEYNLLAFVVGYAVASYGVLILAFAGNLSKNSLFIWLIFMSLSGSYGWLRRSNKISLFREVRKAFAHLEPLKRLILLVGSSILLITFILTITPPYDYDSQLYHLEVPRIFLKNGGISPLSDNWLTYFPLNIEMLFTLGLGLGSDIFAKLVNLTYGCILVLSSYSFGKRYIGSWGGWLSAAVLLTIPIFPIWSSWAYIDNGWAVYTFLSAYSVIVWGDTQKRQWLYIAAGLMGVGIGTKYLSFGAAAACGLLVLFLSRKQGWRAVLKIGLLFGIPALSIGLPWYLKNFLWTGDPLYPMFSTPSNWLPGQKEIWMSFVKGFGTGNTWKDYLLLPVNLYLNHERFSTGMGTIEYPSFLFPLILLIPFIGWNRRVGQVAFLSLIQFAVWAAGSQVHRYLLPIYPLLSFLTAHVIVSISRIVHWRRLGLLSGLSLVLGMMTVTFLYSSLLANQLKPFGVIFGLENRNDFLERNVEDYGAIQFIRDELREDNRVLMLWDGRGYYCQDQCFPDLDHSQWTSIVISAEKDLQSVAQVVSTRGVTHLLINYSDVDYILQHDPLKYHQQAYLFLRDVFIPRCTDEVYRDSMNLVLELTCN